MGSCCSAPPTWQSSPACLIRPSTCPFTLPHPNFPPNAQRHATFPHLTHPYASSSPPANLHPALSHLHTISIFPQSLHFISFPTSPLLPILPSLRLSLSLPLTNAPSHPVPLSPALSFLWICRLVFRRRESPLLRLPLPSGLVAATSFSRVARALCWSQEGKPEPGFAAKQNPTLQAKLGFQRGGAKGGNPSPAPQVRPREVWEVGQVGHPPGRAIFLTT